MCKLFELIIAAIQLDHFSLQLSLVFEELLLRFFQFAIVFQCLLNLFLSVDIYEESNPPRDNVILVLQWNYRKHMPDIIFRILFTKSVLRLPWDLPRDRGIE